ncbi:MAG: glycosyl transferase family 2 [Ahrensia sp.]|nr:glycosyl transferase family 2 [Ahrensia sp.]
MRDRRSFGRAVQFTLSLARLQGLTGVFGFIRETARRSATPQYDYTSWADAYDNVTAFDLEEMRRQVASFSSKPLISVVMPVYNAPERFLRQAIESVIAQVYPHWELCIADDCSTDPRIPEILREYAAKDTRIKVVYRDQNGHISRASNTALDIATGEWVALLDQDDLLAPHSLFLAAQTISAHPYATMLYSDEDKIDDSGRRFDPYFKSDWDETLFMGHNMFSHLGVYKRSLLTEIGGFRPGYEGAQDYDLALRCIERTGRDKIIHIPRVLYHWRAIPGSTAQGPGEKNYAILAAERALNEHLARSGVAGRVDEIAGRGMTRLRFDIPDPAPSVSIVIPTRNGVSLLNTCVESIKASSAYKNYEIVVVDNGSDEAATLTYLQQLAEQPRIRVLRYPGAFNYSAINNFAVRQLESDIVCLLNNDIEVESPDWLNEMVSFAIQPHIGAVGAKLLYPDTSIQHAGVVTGMTGVAGHIHVGQPAETRGMMCRNELVHEVSAVTAACMVVRRALYEETGGLDEINLKVAYNDVDFCLKLREAGYVNIWTPHAVLYHHESRTRGYETTPEKQERFAREQAYMYDRWPKWIERDPAYNPNLSLDTTDGAYACPPRPWKANGPGKAT